MSDGKNRKEKKKKDSDPLVDSTMSLGDHLEELRARLILAILGLVIGAIVCLVPFVGKRIIGFIERPYLNVVKAHPDKFRTLPAEPNSIEFIQRLWTNLVEGLASDPNAPSVDPNLITFLQGVYADTMTAWASDAESSAGSSTRDQIPPGYRLKTLAPADAIVSYMKISLISGLILASPWVFYQLWMFVAAGLYEHERQYVRRAVPFSAALFVCGALFFLFVVAPISMRFFLKFGAYINVEPNWTLQKYVSFVTILMLVFGIAFQTPIAIFILNRTGLVSIESLRSSRKFVLLGVFVVAAMTTPPDVVSQITLAIPLYMLFELGIILSRIAQRRRKSKSNG
jgi:sec-independent protein translocase protein TatC